MLQFVEPQPAGFQSIVAVGEAREIAGDGSDEGFDHRVLHDVGEVAVARRCRQLAPAVDGLLVLGKRVGDQRE